MTLHDELNTQLNAWIKRSIAFPDEYAEGAKEVIRELLNDLPRQCIDLLNQAEMDIKRIRQEFHNEWRFCAGCKDYVKRAEAYEGVVHIPVDNLDDSNNTRHALKCCKCNTIIDFLD